jgi:hypothetical protein
MRIRPACLVFVVLLLVPALTYADSHNADFNGGGSGGGGGSKLGGFIVGFGKAEMTSEPGGDRRRPCLLGWFGDASVQFGKHAGKEVTQVVLAVGPRCTILAKHDSMNLFHAHAQLGDVYTNDGKGGGKPNDTALVVGLAFDRALHRRPSSTPKTPFAGAGFRLQADRVFNLGDRESVWRLSAGLVYRVPRL